MGVDYQWDPDKARVNLKKHGVDFADAVGVFEDPLSLTIDDPGSPEEPRWIILGWILGVAFRWWFTLIGKRLFA